MQKALSSFGGSLLSAASTSSGESAASSSSGSAITCEICDQAILDREKYFTHLQVGQFYIMSVQFAEFFLHFLVCTIHDFRCSTNRCAARVSRICSRAAPHLPAVGAESGKEMENKRKKKLFI